MRKLLYYLFYFRERTFPNSSKIFVAVRLICTSESGISKIVSNIVSRKVKSPFESMPNFYTITIIILLLHIDSKQNNSDSKTAQAVAFPTFDLI